MLAGPSTDVVTIRNHLRDADQAARRLIARAAYMERLARRPGASSTERARLDDRAQELRGAAAALSAAICDLSRQVASPARS
jgi:hypothetical protein